MTVTFTQAEKKLLRDTEYASDADVSDFNHLDPVDARQLLWEMLEREWGIGARGMPTSLPKAAAKSVVKKLARIVADTY